MTRTPSLVCASVLTTLTALLFFTSSAIAIEQTVYTFQGTLAGKDSDTRLIADASGHLFGATALGGYKNNGLVFELFPKIGGGWNYRAIHYFKGSTDGANPLGCLVFDSAGNLYGVTSRQGAWERGTVYELSPNSNGSWTEQVIYSFQDVNDAQFPAAGLMIDSAGNLYGTANSGGANGVGAVYKLTPNSDGIWSESVLYSFGSSSNDGMYTWAEVIPDAAGNLYGTTVLGGAFGLGTVYELSPTSGGSWNETVLYSFTGHADQGIPKAALYMNPAGNLFGTASDDGEGSVGTVFELIHNSDSSWTESTIHTFGGPGDGSAPFSNLVADNSGNLYGTTYIGGVNGAGTVYRMHPTTSGGWTENIVYSFTGLNDGNAPQAGLMFNGKSTLFGVTELGGSANDGTVFSATIQ